MSPLKMYAELAKWWPLLSPADEYVEEATFFLQSLHDAGVKEGSTLLELGSGGGSNAYHFKQVYTLTLTDLSPEMLAVSQSINPKCEHIAADMRTLRLGREFDVVFAHDALDYMLTEADVRQALEIAYLHLKPGGVALFVPDHMRETFEPDSDHGGRDGEDGRGLRYLEWTFDPDENDTTYTTHYVFMLREGDTMHVEHDQHTCGLFPRAFWLQTLAAVGFQTTHLEDNFGRDLFLCLRPRL
ncbi:MAG: class I SAM-dependent methyltransferase [Chloroflexi bacterium]|nr:class I SAM-dependent methyltransferase [Chloroflexota bacterium]